MTTDPTPRRGVKRGDVVRLTIGAWSVDAWVGLASANGRSLFVFFDGAAPVGDGSMVLLGTMALLQADDGTWTEITRNTPVLVAPRETPSSVN